MQDNNDVQFCNTTNLDNELQKNLEENENNDENVTNEQVHHNHVQLEENENNNAHVEFWSQLRQTYLPPLIPPLIHYWFEL